MTDRSPRDSRLRRASLPLFVGLAVCVGLVASFGLRSGTTSPARDNQIDVGEGGSQTVTPDPRPIRIDGVVRMLPAEIVTGANPIEDPPAWTARAMEAWPRSLGTPQPLALSDGSVALVGYTDTAFLVLLDSELPHELGVAPTSAEIDGVAVTVYSHGLSPEVVRGFVAGATGGS